MRGKCLVLAFAAAHLCTTTTVHAGDKEGNGGDEVGIEFAADARVALANVAKFGSSLFPAVNLPQLTDELNQVVQNIIVVDEPIYLKYPGAILEPLAVNSVNGAGVLTIVINRQRWNECGDEMVRQSLALHELLCLEGVEKTGDYNVSSNYLFMMEPAPQSKPGREYICTLSVDVDESELPSTPPDMLLGATLQLANGARGTPGSFNINAPDNPDALLALEGFFVTRSPAYMAENLSIYEYSDGQIVRLAILSPIIGEGSRVVPIYDGKYFATFSCAILQ